MVDKILVQEVFDPDLQNLIRFEQQLVIFFGVIEFSLKAGGVHLLREKLDIMYRANHVVGDRRVQRFHHVVLLALLLELQILGNVT